MEAQPDRKRQPKNFSKRTQKLVSNFHLGGNFLADALVFLRIRRNCRSEVEAAPETGLRRYLSQGSS
jgi:hypothetical protein